MWVENRLTIFKSNIKLISLLLYTLSKPHINFLGIFQMDISKHDGLIRAKYFNLSRLFNNKQYKRAKAPYSYLLQNLSCKEHFIFYFGLKVSLSCSLQLDKKKIECHITITWYIYTWQTITFTLLFTLHQKISQHCLFGFVKQVSSLLGFPCSFPKTFSTIQWNGHTHTESVT